MPLTNNNKVTVKQAARMMGTFTTYVHSLIYAGKLSAVKRHGVWFLDRIEVQTYAARLKARRRSTSDVLAGDGDAA
jgi:hypothetical protein